MYTTQSGIRLELIDTNPTRVPPLANAPRTATAHTGKLKASARDDAAATGTRALGRRVPVA